MFENISDIDKYTTTAYMLPIKLDNSILATLIAFLQIIAVASNIIQFIHRFSKNIISKYTVKASPLKNRKFLYSSLFTIHCSLRYSFEARNDEGVVPYNVQLICYKQLNIF